MIRFDGQAAIVTGAGSGIGRAIALLLAARGAKVLVNDPVGAAVVAADICAAGGEAVAETTAVGSHEAARRIAAAAQDTFGRIDILINNAGIVRPGPFGAASDAEVDRVMAVNLTGPFALMRAVWPVMAAQAYGRVVNFSSGAVLGSGISGPYAVSKAGLIGLTKDAAIDGGKHGIRVNAVMPQAYTAMLENHPDPAYRAWMQRTMPPEPVAAAVAFLASRDVPVSGEIFAAGGGLMARIAFIEGQGHHDPALTVEQVRDHFDAVCDLSKGEILVNLADQDRLHQSTMTGNPS